MKPLPKISELVDIHIRPLDWSRVRKMVVRGGGWGDRRRIAGFSWRADDFQHQRWVGFRCSRP